MMRPTTLALAVALVALSSEARAFDESTRRPFYVQTAVGSYSYWPVLFQDTAFWKPDIEFGVHFTGRHDGLEIAIRQAFDVGRADYSMGETAIRGGWDFALPFRNGRFELTLAPFGTLGANYTFRNAHAGFHMSAGIDVKLFFFQGLYVFLRPIELGFGQFVDLLAPNQNVFFTINGGLGLGYAF